MRFDPVSGGDRPYATAAANRTNAPGQFEPSDFEQYMLELINRARAAPLAEIQLLTDHPYWNAEPALNEGLAPGTITAEPKQPLAFDLHLVEAAGNYSQRLMDHDAFEHRFGQTTLLSRMKAAGFAVTPADALGENLAVNGDSHKLPIDATITEDQHIALFIDAGVRNRAHRTTMMNPAFNLVGIGIRAGAGYDLFAPELPNAFAVLSTIDLAAISSRPGPFVTGVVFPGDNGDRFYAPGKGAGGVSVELLDAGTLEVRAETLTFASGGYTLEVPAPGDYQVRFTGLAVGPIFQHVSVGAQNVQVNVIPEPSTVAWFALAATVRLRPRRGAIWSRPPTRATPVAVSGRAG